MPSSSLSRLPGRFLPLLACIAPATTYAQLSTPDTSAETVALDRMIVSASRSPQDPRYVSSSVTALSLNDLGVEQIGDLRTALSQQPGVLVLNTGAFGSTSSVSIRGGNSYQTLFVVDGVRMNDRSADYGNFLGGADLANVGHIEILRGPQSTLYGSSAMGGVILTDSLQGQGPTSGAISATAGSFHTWGASAAASGSTGGLSYSGSVGRLATANDRTYNGFREWSYATRIAYTLTPTVQIGATFRALDGQYEEPGSTSFVSPGSVHAQNYLGTVFAQTRIGDDFTSRLTLAVHRRLYNFSYTGGVSDLLNTRKILDWQNTWEVSPQLEVVAGTNFEDSRYTVDGVKTTDNLGAGYISTTARPIKSVTLTAGLRYDDYKSVGSATTWRLGGSWLLNPATKIHATYGTGFSAPGSDDRYGVAEFGELPNPDLKPEKSRGWDAGISQDLLAGKVTVAATYFRNQFRGLFQFQYVDFVTYQGRVVNIARATTDGVELAASANLGSQWKLHGAFTYMNATDDTAKVRLGRRPRQVGDGDVTYIATSAWTLGAGLHWVSDQVDGVGAFPDYTTVRLFTSYAVRKDLILKLRVENALDKHYEEVRGYPALPLGAFGSVEWRF